MTDYGTFKVQSDALRAESTVWKQKSANASKALTQVATAVDQGSAFGVMAGSCGVTGNYNTWSEAMQQALKDAQHCFDYLEAALLSAANGYDGVDATVATGVQKLNDMAKLPAPGPTGTTGTQGTTGAPGSTATPGTVPPAPMPTPTNPGNHGGVVAI